MPAPPDKDRKTSEEFPDPELNPMTNSLLAQNMGRWAEIYFTTPAEKREEAVRELLRELKAGVKTLPSGVAQESIANSDREILGAKEKFAELEKQFAELNRKRAAPRERASGAAQPAADEILCPACLSKNKSSQRYCGLCGFTLNSNPSESPQARENPKAQTAEPSPAAPERDGNDWGWLHERNRSVFAEKQADGASWKVAVLVALVLIAGGAGYLWWQGKLQTSSADQKPRSGVKQGPTMQPHAAAPSGTVESESPVERTPSTGKTAQTIPPTSQGSDDTKTDGNPAISGTTSEMKATENPTSSAATKTPAAPIEGGQHELETARRYMDGRGVPKDSALAAQWLWKSVAKKNTKAILILSGMYVAGEGVPQNCDQARLLLISAAQKGSQEAREKLKDVVANCP